MTTTDRLVAALHARNPETTRLVENAVRRLAAQVHPDQLTQIADAAEHPIGVTTGEMVARSGATLRQVNYWTEEGYLTAEQTAAGSGHPRRYPTGQLSKATLMHRLVNLLGMHPNHASYAADELLAKGHARVPGLELTRRTR